MKKKIFMPMLVLAGLAAVYGGGYRAYRGWSWKSIEAHFQIEGGYFMSAGPELQGLNADQINQKFRSYIQEQTPALWAIFRPLGRRDPKFPGNTVYWAAQPVNVIPPAPAPN